MSANHGRDPAVVRGFEQGNHGYMGEQQMTFPGPTALQFGEHVRRVRGRLGFSVDEFAKRAQLEAATVEELEAGRREPMYPELWALAWGLGLSNPGPLFRMWERRSLDEPGELL